MLIRFQSKACADVLMRQADAHQLLQAMQRPAQPRGIVQWADAPAALAHLAQAVAADEALRLQAAAAQDVAQGAPQRLVQGDTAQQERAQMQMQMPQVSLSQRAAPMRQMLQRSFAAQADVVWGV